MARWKVALLRRQGLEFPLEVTYTDPQAGTSSAASTLDVVVVGKMVVSPSLTGRGALWAKKVDQAPTSAVAAWPICSSD